MIKAGSNTIGSAIINSSEIVKAYYRGYLVYYKQPEQYIVFVDPLVEQICATNWGDGTCIKPSQAARVTDIGTVFNSSAITSFDEFGEYFTNVASLFGANTGATAFNSCTGLESITIPSSVTSIGARAFTGCSSLKSIVFPASVVSFGNNILLSCTALDYVEVNSDIQTNNFTSANNSFGSGIGTLLINANLLVDARYIFGFNFNTIHVTGNIEDIVNGTRACFASSNLEKVIIDGNVIRSYTLISGTNIKFFELGGTYNYMVLPSAGSNIIAHLKYNGVAGTPANIRIAAVSKVYVDSQAVLNQYLADSAWSSYSAKLDLWENYNGEYKD